MEVHLGIDVGGTKVAAGLVNADGRLLGWSRQESKPEFAPDAMIVRMVSQVEELLSKHGFSAENLISVGAGFPGNFTPTGGVLKTIPNLPHFVGEAPGRLLENAFRERFGIDLPVATDNDAVVATLAEAFCGAGQGVSRLLYMTVSTGVGGARLAGAVATNLEPGLCLYPDPQQPACSLEKLAGGKELALAVQRQLRQRWLENSAEPSLDPLNQFLDLCEVSGTTLEEKISGLTARHLGIAAGKGDQFSRHVFEQAAAHVAAGLAILISQGFGEKRIILGGSIAEKVPNYLGMVKVTLAALQKKENTNPELRKFPLERGLVPAVLGEERGIIGAVILATGWPLCS